MNPDSDISVVHPDIIQTHIFTRLDGPTLASAACASSQLHALSSDENLWREICHKTWPSTADPRVRHLISAFPAGHRSFYSDSFPAIHSRRRPPSDCNPPPPASELISAVDLHYQNRPILSKVQHTETSTGWFLCSPFRVDMIDPKDTVPSPVKIDTCQSKLEENFALSWILVDPTRNRAANLSSLKPVSVTRHWLTGDLNIRFATVLAGDKKGESVQCAAVVTCGGKGSGELHVKEVSLVVEDMEGRNLSGKESLVILQDAMENGERRRRKRGEGRESYEVYTEMRRERRESKQRRERRMDMVCITTVITVLIIIWAFFMLKISS